MPLLRHWFVHGLTLCFLLSLCGCGHSSPTVVKRENETPPDTVPSLRNADDTGRFIAGLPGAVGSPFATLEGTEAWNEHRHRLDEAWHKAEASLVSGLQEFQQEELNEAPLQLSRVFYPFSGPDALTLAQTICDHVEAITGPQLQPIRRTIHN